MLVLVLLSAREGTLPMIITFAVIGLLGYRRFRNSTLRLSRRFANKARRLAEVRIIAVDGRNITVVTDKALARTYVKLNALLDAINARLFFGEHFQLVVRDEVSAEEAKALLAGRGVLYVREEAPPSAPPASTGA